MERAHRRARARRCRGAGAGRASPIVRATIIAARRLGERVVERARTRAARQRRAVAFHRRRVAAQDRAGRLEVVLDRPRHQRQEGLRRRPGLGEQAARRPGERHEEVRGDRAPRVVERPPVVGEHERLQPERVGEPSPAVRAASLSPSRPPRHRRAARARGWRRASAAGGPRSGVRAGRVPRAACRPRRAPPRGRARSPRATSAIAGRGRRGAAGRRRRARRRRARASARRWPRRRGRRR